MKARSLISSSVLTMTAVLTGCAQSDFDNYSADDPNRTAPAAVPADSETVTAGKVIQGDHDAPADPSRQQFIGDIEETLARTDRTIAELDARRDQWTPEQQQQWDQMKTNLQERRQRVQSHLDSLRTAADDAWNAEREAARTDVEQLRETIDQARAAFSTATAEPRLQGEATPTVNDPAPTGESP